MTTTAGVRLSNRLTARWAAAVTGDRSTALSGAAVWPLLAYLAAAAAGPGRAELEAAVGLDGEAARHEAGELLAGLGGSPALRSAIGVWAARQVTFSEWWRRAVPAGTWGRLSGDPAADKATLDAWVRDRTGGLLGELGVEPDPELRLLLVAALTVETRWDQPFTVERLRATAGPWTGRWLHGLYRERADLDELTVADTTAGPVTLLAVAGEGDVTVRLALGEPARSAAEVLAGTLGWLDGERPGRTGSSLREGDTAPGLAFGFSGSDVEGPKLHAILPRFSVTASHDLLADAGLFGLAAVTDERRGHFPRMSDDPLAVRLARQDLTASFSEDGFRAAALTVLGGVAGGMGRRQPRSLFLSLDRPFAFVASSRRTGLVLLAGWVAEVEDLKASSIRLG